PIESTMGDPATLISAGGLSIRAPLNLTGPPAHMAAYIKLLTSPEVARRLAADPRSAGAILLLSPDEILRLPIETRVQRILRWLERNVSTDQDQDVRTWTINLRHADAATAIYLLKKVNDSDEGILRQAALAQ